MTLKLYTSTMSTAFLPEFLSLLGHCELISNDLRWRHHLSVRKLHATLNFIKRICYQCWGDDGIGLSFVNCSAVLNIISFHAPSNWNVCPTARLVVPRRQRFLSEPWTHGHIVSSAITLRIREYNVTQELKIT